jgi:hypothetical protein
MTTLTVDQLLIKTPTEYSPTPADGQSPELVRTSVRECEANIGNFQHTSIALRGNKYIAKN